MPSNVRDDRFIISSFACTTLDPVSSHHPFHHPLIRWALSQQVPLVTLDMPQYGNQWPATDQTSKQTQFNASLQVVYSSIVRLVTNIDPEATMNLMPDKTPGPPIVNITYNATAEQSDITETPPMKRSKLNSFMNDHYPSDTA